MKFDFVKKLLNLHVSHIARVIIIMLITFFIPSSQTWGDVFREGDNPGREWEISDTLIIGNLGYEITRLEGEGGENEVYACDPFGDAYGHEVIPETITFNSEVFNVTGINILGFAGNTKLTSVEMPTSIDHIGPHAFENCTNLNNINTTGNDIYGNFIPDNVSEIAERAFYNCSLSGYLYTGDNCKHIGESAFQNNYLNSIAIGELADIDDYAFYGNPCDYISLPSYLNYFTDILDDVEEITIPVIINKERMSGVTAKSVFYLSDNLPSTNTNFFSDSQISNIYLKPSVLETCKKESDWSQWSAAYHITDSVPLSIPADRHFITTCRDFDMDLRHVNDNLQPGVEPLKAYIVSGIETEKNAITLQEVKYIPSHLYYHFNDPYDSGVLIKGTPGHTYYYTIGEDDYTKGKSNQMTWEKALALTGSAIPTTDVKLQGCDIPTLINSFEIDYCFGLKNDKFCKYSESGIIPHNRSYLYNPHSYNINSKKEISLIFNNADGTTSIENITPHKNIAEKGVKYNLQGMRVDDSYHGIIIVNGHKIFKK